MDRIIKFSGASKSIFTASCLSVFISSGCTVQEKAEKKPNIIFLLTDDHRWDAMGIMGNNIIKTPNMDQLAGDGVLFTNAHVTTSICMCSRASILSGQYTSRHGIKDFTTDMTEEAVNQTYPLLLKNNAGYKIGFIGKYGIGINNHPADKYDYWRCEKMYQPNYENFDANGNIRYYDDINSDRIDTFLTEFGTKGPFCLSVSFKAPHCQDGDPRQFIYPPRYKDLYAGVTIPAPETADSSYYYFFPEDFRNRLVKKTGGVVMNEARKRWKIRFPNYEKYQETVRSYYRLITQVDDVIGKLREKLKEIGIDKNTVIIFMGDNGFYLGEHGLAGKWFAHRESTRVPFFVYDPRAPKKQRGVRNDDFAFNIDVAPTILSLAGVDIPEEMQGVNALGLVSGDVPKREEFYYEYPVNMDVLPATEAYISKKYKYIKYPTLAGPFEELYDEKNDPLEKHSLVDNPEYAAVLKEMREKIETMKQAVK